MCSDNKSKVVLLQSSFKSLAEGEIEGDTLDLLGPLVPFLERGTLSLVDREDFTVWLDDVRGYCLPTETLRDVSALLTERNLLGYRNKMCLD